MKALPVGALKAQFSDVLTQVRNGETFRILYGKEKTPIAMIVPFEEEKERKLGILEGKINIKFADDFKISEEDLLGLS